MPARTTWMNALFDATVGRFAPEGPMGLLDVRRGCAYHRAPIGVDSRIDVSVRHQIAVARNPGRD